MLMVGGTFESTTAVKSGKNPGLRNMPLTRLCWSRGVMATRLTMGEVVILYFTEPACRGRWPCPGIPDFKVQMRASWTACICRIKRWHLLFWQVFRPVQENIPAHSVWGFIDFGLHVAGNGFLEIPAGEHTRWNCRWGCLKVEHISIAKWRYLDAGDIALCSRIHRQTLPSFGLDVQSGMKVVGPDFWTYYGPEKFCFPGLIGKGKNPSLFGKVALG